MPDVVQTPGSNRMHEWERQLDNSSGNIGELGRKINEVSMKTRGPIEKLPMCCVVLGLLV